MVQIHLHLVILLSVVEMVVKNMVVQEVETLEDQVGVHPILVLEDLVRQVKEILVVLDNLVVTGQLVAVAVRVLQVVMLPITVLLDMVVTVKHGTVLHMLEEAVDVHLAVEPLVMVDQVEEVMVP
jgi:hypothetical protein